MPGIVATTNERGAPLLAPSQCGVSVHVRNDANHEQKRTPSCEKKGDDSDEVCRGAVRDLMSG